MVPGSSPSGSGIPDFILTYTTTVSGYCKLWTVRTTVRSMPELELGLCRSLLMETFS